MKFLAFLACLVGSSSAFVAVHMSAQKPVSRAEFVRSSGIAAAAAVGLATAAPPLPASAAAIPAVGASAPDFTLPSNTGKDISLSDLTKTGKKTVLYFYPGDFTSGCTIEAQGFQKDFAKYGELGAQIVGVSVDSVDKHLDFQKSYGLDFPLLSDVGAVVADQYGTKLEIPFLGKFANRQTYIVGKDGKIEKVFTDVESRVAKHSADILDYLKQ